MIKPSEIKTRDKERDAEILNLFVHNHERLEDIAAKFGLNKSTISYIISKNKEIIKIDKEFHKLKRINFLERMLSNCSIDLAKGRDASDILKELRAEYEGDKAQVSVLNQFFTVNPDTSVKNRLTEFPSEIQP